MHGRPLSFDHSVPHAKLYLSEEHSSALSCVFWETKVTGITPLQILMWGNSDEKA